MGAIETRSYRYKGRDILPTEDGTGFWVPGIISEDNPSS